MQKWKAVATSCWNLFTGPAKQQFTIFDRPGMQSGLLDKKYTLPFCGLCSSFNIESSQCFHWRIYKRNDKNEKWSKNATRVVKKWWNKFTWAIKQQCNYTFNPPASKVRAQKMTCTTASTKIKMWRWCNAVVDNNGTFPWSNISRKKKE